MTHEESVEQRSSGSRKADQEGRVGARRDIPGGRPATHPFAGRDARPLIDQIAQPLTLLSDDSPRKIADALHFLECAERLAAIAEPVLRQSDQLGSCPPIERRGSGSSKLECLCELPAPVCEPG